MTNSAVNVSFTGPEASDTSKLDEWAKLEQVDAPKSSEGATIADAVNMVAYAKQGNSAFDYIADSCTYITVKDGAVIVKLQFWVWPSSMDLDYTLETSIGEIEAGTKVSKIKSFDVIFDKSDSVDVGFIFDGTLKPEMPFFASLGSDISPDPVITQDRTKIELSTTCTTVLRATGRAEGYKHTLTIELATSTKEKIDSDTGEKVTLTGYSLPNPEITVVWGNCEENDTQCIETHKDELELSVPQCVTDLLNACGEEEPATSLENLYDDWKYVVQWDTCRGIIVNEFFKDADE